MSAVISVLTFTCQSVQLVSPGARKHICPSDRLCRVIVRWTYSVMSVDLGEESTVNMRRKKKRKKKKCSSWLSILYVFLPLIQLQYLRRPLDATKFYAAVLWMCSLEASSRESVTLTWSTAAEECASVLRPWRSDLSGIQTFRPHCDHNYQVTVTEEKKKRLFLKESLCRLRGSVLWLYCTRGSWLFFSLTVCPFFVEDTDRVWNGR